MIDGDFNIIPPADPLQSANRLADRKKQKNDRNKKQNEKKTQKDDSAQPEQTSDDQENNSFDGTLGIDYRA